MTIKHIATEQDDLLWQSALRLARGRMPSAASLLASKLQEQLGMLSDVVSELARLADAGNADADRELITLECDIYDQLAECRAVVAGKDGGK
jgi:hypothetical protein